MGKAQRKDLIRGGSETKIITNKRPHRTTMLDQRIFVLRFLRIDITKHGKGQTLCLTNLRIHDVNVAVLQANLHHLNQQTLKSESEQIHSQQSSSFQGTLPRIVRGRQTRNLSPVTGVRPLQTGGVLQCAQNITSVASLISQILTTRSIPPLRSLPSRLPIKQHQIT